MGICASSRITRGGSDGGAVGMVEWASTAKVVHVEGGGVRGYGWPTRAGHVEAENPGCYLCSSESMHVGEHAPRMTEGEVLQPGQIYFLMPLARSGKPLCLSDLCELAVDASAALRRLPASSAAGCPKAKVAL